MLFSYIYKFIERVLTHATTFVVSILLARLLTPSDYGTLAIVNVFVVFTQVLIEGGLGSALIQKKDTSNDDYGTTLTLTLLLSSFIYSILYIFSGRIENWLGMDGLSQYLRILALILFPSSFLSIYKAKLVREMRFKIQMYITLVCTLISGFIGILLAHLGFGIWSLIAQQICVCLLLVISYALFTKWIPIVTLRLNFNRAKQLYNYGWKIMVTNLIVRADKEIMGLAIGKCCSPSTLGLYDRGKQFPQAAAENIESTIQSVLFPSLSKIQEEKRSVVKKTRWMMILSSYISFFLLTLVASTSISYIPILLTNKWEQCIPYLILWCICYLPSVPNIISTTAINAVGLSKLTLKRQIVSTFPALVVCLITVLIIPNAIYVLIVKVMLIPYFFSITSFYLNKAIPYTIIEQIKDLLPNLCASILVFVITYSVKFMGLNIYLQLFIQIILGFAVFFLISITCKLKGFVILKDTIIRFNQKRV